MADDNTTLHPLVVINISDHFTRTRANSAAGASAPRVYGAVLGAPNRPAGMGVAKCPRFKTPGGWGSRQHGRDRRRAAACQAHPDDIPVLLVPARLIRRAGWTARGAHDVVRNEDEDGRRRRG